MVPSRLPPRGTGPTMGSDPQGLTPADGRSSQRDTNRRSRVPKGNPWAVRPLGALQGAPEEVPLGPPGAARPPRGCQPGTREPVAPSWGSPARLLALENREMVSGEIVRFRQPRVAPADCTLEGEYQGASRIPSHRLTISPT